jgi:hypothetical protein
MYINNSFKSIRQRNNYQSSFEKANDNKLFAFKNILIYIFTHLQMASGSGHLYLIVLNLDNTIIFNC